jgi:hypothetical protein
MENNRFLQCDYVLDKSPAAVQSVNWTQLEVASSPKPWEISGLLILGLFNVTW